MAKDKTVAAQREDELLEADVIPEEQSQIAVRESMDVDPRTGTEVKLGVPERTDEEEVADFIEWLKASAVAANQDTMSSLAELLRASRSAESVAEALKETQTISGDDFVGVPFMAMGFDIHESNLEDVEIPYFASVRAQHPNYPQGLIVNCGGLKVLAHMQTLERLDAFPIALCVTGKRTSSGHTVLSLEKIEQRPL